MEVARTNSLGTLEAAIASCGIGPRVDRFDAAGWIADPRNIALAVGPNLGLFEPSHGGTHEAHWLMADRGKAALAAGRAMLTAMFERHDSAAVHGKTPAICRGACLFNRLLGGQSLGFADTPRGRVEIFYLSRTAWMERAMS